MRFDSSTKVGLALALFCCHGRTIMGDEETWTSISSQQTSRGLNFVDVICEPTRKHGIDWDCIFGEESLEEVDDHEDDGAKFTTCPTATEHEPCSRFILPKGAERTEVKVQEGPEGFGFRKGEKYTFKYSFRAREGMRVSKRFTHLGQLKGSKGGYMVKGDPIFSLTANNRGLMVRFSNKESIDDYVDGMDTHMDWDAATGEWVHVEIQTVFGKSMEVFVSGAVKGHAVWPQHLKPVAWNNDGDMVRMKIGLYHAKDEVADGEVEYKNISIEGPSGRIRTSSRRIPDESKYLGCYKDRVRNRVLTGDSMSRKNMTPKTCFDLCQASKSKYFGLEYSNECFCGRASDEYDEYGQGVCDMECSGESGVLCGGNKAIDVYRILY